MEINKIYNADCLEGISGLANRSVKTIIADPPYFQGLTHNGFKGAFTDLAVSKPFFTNLFNEYKRVLRDDGCVYFFTDWRGYAFYYPIFDTVLRACNMLVWSKHSRPMKKNYGYGHEIIIFSGGGNLQNTVFDNVIKDIRSFNGGAKKTNGEKLHPTQKPVELIEKFIKDSTEEGDLVLDTFIGSGTTALACINLNRNFIGFEIDECYFNVANERINSLLI